MIRPSCPGTIPDLPPLLDLFKMHHSKGVGVGNGSGVGIGSGSSGVGVGVGVGDGSSQGSSGSSGDGHGVGVGVGVGVWLWPTASGTVPAVALTKPVPTAIPENIKANTPKASTRFLDILILPP